MRSKMEPGLYWDSRIPGLGVRVSKTKRAFIFQKSGGKRHTIGHWRDGVGMSVQDARKEANRRTDDILDPSSAPSGITVREALENKTNKLNLRVKTNDASQQTVDNYRNVIETHAPDWLDKALSEITSADLVDRHEQVGFVGSHGRGPAPIRANTLIRVMRLLHHDAARRDDTLGDWPGKNKIEWFPEPRRNEPVEDLRAWRQDIERTAAYYKSLDAKPVSKRKEKHGFERKRGTMTRDWWLLVLYTGLRKSDVLKMKWEHISEDGQWVHIPTPKGGSKKAFDLPLSTQAQRILERLKESKVCEFVFWTIGKDGDFTHMKSARTAITRGMPSPHRLRDTWATNAAEAGCPFPIIKKLMNHSVSKTDVTLGYINPGRDSLLEWAQKVADHIEAKMKTGSC